jgi:segregation and condensation protein B
MTITEYEAIIESLLFVAGEPAPIEKIAKALDVSVGDAKKILLNMRDKYENENRGVILIKVGEAYQMCANPKYFSYVEKIYKRAKKKALSQTLVETLAIIAYKQPITKVQIEEIRGVNSDHAVNKLLEYGLITEKGRLDVPGRPILFVSSDEFLRYYGYDSLEGLPKIL